MLDSFQGYQICLQCKNSTKNPKFCSRSCAATYNNKTFVKRQKLLLPCKICGSERYSKRQSGLCKACIDIRIARKNQSLEEIIQHKKSIDSASYNIYNTIRGRARTLILKWGWIKCANCGYDKHVKACHIKAVSSFSISNTVDEINSKSNLIALCRNCHWELDHGLLHIDG